MTDNKDKVKVPGELVSAGKYPVVSTDAVIDKHSGKTQEVINEGVRSLENKSNSMDARLTQVEDLVEISIDGSSFEIASSRDFINRTSAGDVKIPTVEAILDGAINEVAVGSPRLITSGAVYHSMNTLNATITAKIDEIYINNGIRIFDGLTNPQQLVIVTPGSPSSSARGEVIWYKAQKIFLYKVQTSGSSLQPIYTFYADWANKSLYVDSYGHLYNTLLYVCGTSNYRAVNGDLELVEDSASVTRRLDDADAAIASLQIDVSNLEESIDNLSVKEVSYVELSELISRNKLEPGRKYRIIDYCSWFNKEYVGMSFHVFDLIVEAISPHELDPKATAVVPKYRDDSFMGKVNLPAFQIWYSPMVLRFETEKYAPFMCDDIIPEEMVVIVNGVNEIFYCKSFESKKLYYQGKTYASNIKTVLHPVKYQTDSLRGIYAEFMVHPDSEDFKPSSNEYVFRVFRAPSLDDADDFDSYVATDYKANQILVLRKCGYIYKMIDDNGNEAPYDFKNLVYQMHPFDSATRETHITDQSLVQEITNEADTTENSMHYSIYGFPDMTIKSYSGYTSNYIKARYISHVENPIIGIDAQYFFTFNKFINGFPVDMTVPLTEGALVPRNNKIAFRGVSIQVPGSYNGVIDNNNFYGKNLIVVTTENLINVTCSPNNIIVISSSAYLHPVEGEYIAKVAGFNGDNQLMVHSNETMMFRDFSEETALIIAGPR